MTFTTNHDRANRRYELLYSGRVIATANTLYALNTAFRDRERILAAWRQGRRK